jgi:hypothetical protein
MRWAVRGELKLPWLWFTLRGQQYELWLTPRAWEWHWWEFMHADSNVCSCVNIQAGPVGFTWLAKECCWKS